MNRLSFVLSLCASLLAVSSLAQAETLDAQLVADAVADAARRNLPDTVAAIEVHSIQLRRAPTIAAGANVSVRVRADGADDWIGHTNLDVLLTVDGVLHDPFRGSAEILAMVEVPVMREPLPRGERVREEHLDLVMRDAERLPGGMLRHTRDIVGRSTKRDLGLNQMVRSSDLSAVVDAQRNRPVTLLVGAGALRVKASGILREDATVGSLVAVWVPSTGSTLHGILRSPDLVELPFAGSQELP